jgi:hypothetical protein
VQKPAAVAYRAAAVSLPASCQQGVPHHSNTLAAAAAAGTAAVLWQLQPVLPETGWLLALGGGGIRGPGRLAVGAGLCGW